MRVVIVLAEQSFLLAATEQQVRWIFSSHLQHLIILKQWIVIIRFSQLWVLLGD